MRETSRWMLAAGLCVGVLGSAAAAERHHARAAVAVAHDGPFGISMGESVTTLGAVFLKDQGYFPNASYEVPNPPKPNPDFPLVEVVAFPSTGVCEIAAFHAVDADPSGEKARAFVDRIADMLRAKYGPNDNKIDECEDSADACDQTWTFELLEGRANYAYVWNDLPAERYGGIARMQTTIVTKSAASPAALVTYDRHTKACDEAVAAVDATGL